MRKKYIAPLPYAPTHHAYVVPENQVIVRYHDEEHYRRTVGWCGRHADHGTINGVETGNPVTDIYPTSFGTNSQPVSNTPISWVDFGANIKE